MKRYSIELKPFEGQRGGGCHWAVIGVYGFLSGGCRLSVFEAACAAFTAARRVSRAKSISVRVQA